VTGELMDAARQPDQDDLEAIASGELHVLGLLPRASNSTFLAEVSSRGRSVPVVYKPRDGEAPLWDFPEGTLCRREVAAFSLASALGWPNVPATVLRGGPLGEGSVQRFVEHDPRRHYFTMGSAFADVLRAVAAFDVLAGNGDRKAGHCLVAANGTVWSVDHGLCFNERPILRTVIWDFAGEAVPPPLLRDAERVAGELRTGPLRDELIELLSAPEVDAAAARADALVAAGRFPQPGPGRSLPWPAI